MKATMKPLLVLFYGLWFFLSAHQNLSLQRKSQKFLITFWQKSLDFFRITHYPRHSQTPLKSRATFWSYSFVLAHKIGVLGLIKLIFAISLRLQSNSLSRYYFHAKWIWKSPRRHRISFRKLLWSAPRLY